jgi:hypothetical protein
LKAGPQEAAGQLEPLRVVAFSDANDLLTYQLSKRFKEHCANATFANVSVTNADLLWFFAFANPILAHVGYQENDRIIRLIIEGAEPEKTPPLSR